MKWSVEEKRKTWHKIASFDALDYARWFAVHAPLSEIQIVENWPRRRIIVIYRHGEPDREIK